MLNGNVVNFLGGDTYQEGKACYRLGNAYEEQGDPDSAIMVTRALFSTLLFHQILCYFSIIGSIWSAASIMEMMQALEKHMKLWPNLSKG